MKARWIVLLLVLVLSGVGAIVGAGYIFRLALDESLHMRRGSIAFCVTMTSKIVRRCPTIDVRGDVMYYYSCGDGPAPLEYSITYTSGAASDVVQSTLDAHVRSLGAVLLSSGDRQHPRYSTRNGRVRISIEEQDSGLIEVQVTEEVDD